MFLFFDNICNGMVILHLQHGNLFFLCPDRGASIISLNLNREIPIALFS